MDFKHALKALLPNAPTAWLITAGKLDEGKGVFNPDANGPLMMFGVGLSETPGAVGRNKVSQEAQGDLNNLFDPTGTRFLGPEILGATPDPDQRNDLMVTSFVEGAGQALLKLGREKGIIPPLATPKSGEGSSKAATPPSWPDQRAVVESQNQRILELMDLNQNLVVEMHAQQVKIDNIVPEIGGGKFARYLRTEVVFLKGLIEEIRGEIG